MSVKSAPWEVGVVGLLLLGLVTACVGVVGPGGYDGTVGVGYVGDYYEPYGAPYGGYYEPYGAPYGGWGPGYNVAPPRGGEHGGYGDHGGSAGHRGHRGPPSIPSRPPGHR
jgi:hypothetical protein